MQEDDVLQELWRIKDANAARYDYDVRAMVRALRKLQRKGTRKVVERRPKKAA